MKPKYLILFATAGLLILTWWLFQPSGASQVSGTSQGVVDNTTPALPAEGFNKQAHSLTDPNSIWVVINKDRPLPDGWAPADLAVPNVKLSASVNAEPMHLRQPAVEALETLFTAAIKANASLMLFSGYRSQALQASLYNSYVKRDGQAAADRYSARPRYSEHQTGLAADVAPADGSCTAEQCFANTTAGKWLAAHSYQYGFIIRYQEGKESLTGYEYEPWHIRYVGKTLALELHKRGETLEQFFGLPLATSYRN